MGQIIPITFPGEQLTEDSEGTSIEVFCSKDRGRVACITNNFRIVIKGDGIGNEVGSGRGEVSLI